MRKSYRAPGVGGERSRRLPDLSRARSQDLDQDPVYLNGMKVVFDERVGVYPVDLAQVREASDPPAAAPGDRDE